MFSCPVHNLFGVRHWHMWVLPLNNVLHTYRIPIRIDLWPQAQIYIFFYMLPGPTRNFCLLWYWLTIFGTLVYYHEGICRVLSWSRCDVDLYSKIKFMWFFRWFCVRATVSFFDIAKPYLANECITMGQCVTDIPDIFLTLIFGLNISIIFSSWICVWARSSLLFDIGIPNLGISAYITMRQHVYILDLCTTLTFDL